MLVKIVSGGQTGVDRAALDAALELGLACGGWCPHGRRAEDGPIDDRYPLDETASSQYRVRTRWNVRDSDGTLVLTRGRLGGGTALTIALAREQRKPLLIVSLDRRAKVRDVLNWLEARRISVLNVAGPRESTQGPVYARAHAFLRRLLQAARKIK